MFGKTRVMRILATTLVLLLVSMGSARSAKLLNLREIVGMRDACTVLTDEIAEDVYGYETTCGDYLRGWLDAVQASPEPHLGFCLPPDADVVTLARAFVAWANDHRERRHDDVAVGVVEPWREAFPCKK